MRLDKILKILERGEMLNFYLTLVSKLALSLLKKEESER